ncbi:MAG TPA: diguanylate cyclase [Noviherbaspirillum sp.]
MERNAKKRRRHSPYFQLVLTVGMLIATLWGVIYFDVQRTREQAFSKSSSDLTNLALAFAKETESSVKTIDVTLLDLREHWQGNPSGFAAAVRHRQSYLEKEVIFQIAVIDRNGILVYSSLEHPAKPVDLSDREHFRIHRLRSTDELFISKPLLGRVSNRWSIQFTRAIYDKDDRFAGVLVLSVSPEYFYRFYRSIALPQDSVIKLLRGGGEVLSRFPGPELALGKQIGTAPYLAQLSPDAGVFTSVSEIDGVERLQAWRKVDRNDLIVVVGHSVKGIAAPYGVQVSRAVLAGLSLTLLLLFISYLKLLAIRQQQKAAKELEANEERWRLALEAAGDGVWDWNVPDGKVMFSKGWKAMLGYAPDEIRDGLEEWEKRVHPDDMPAVRHDLAEHFNGTREVYANEHRVLCKDGSWKWILDRGMVIQRDRTGNPLRMVGTHTDISSRKEMEEMLKNLATTDPLTGLDNRRRFLERTDSEMARIRRYPASASSLLMADLDYFKRINDTWGHGIGDAALRHFADLLRSTARQSDCAGRIGGEEFAVLLTETTLEEAEQYAQRLCEAVRATPLHTGEQVIPLTVSIGVTQLDITDASPESALHRADEALYDAKHGGRDRFVSKRAVRADDMRIAS